MVAFYAVVNGAFRVIEAFWAGNGDGYRTAMIWVSNSDGMGIEQRWFSTVMNGAFRSREDTLNYLIKLSISRYRQPLFPVDLNRSLVYI